MGGGVRKRVGSAPPRARFAQRHKPLSTTTGQCMSPLYVGSFMKLALVTSTPRKSAISSLPWHAGLSHDT